MTKKTNFIELRANRSLLDSDFGGYKLSLDSIPIYRLNIDTGVKVVQPGDDHYSFYHVKLFSLHNHLHFNPFNSNSVYFIDKKFKVFKVICLPPHQSISFKEVYTIPVSQTQSTQHYNPSIAFGSANIVVMSDGFGWLHFAKISRQNNEETWSGIQSISTEKFFVLMDARVESVGDKRTIDVLMMYVEEKSDEKKEEKGSLFETRIKWKSFEEEGDKWVEKRDREMSVNGSVDCLTLEPGCKSVYIISDRTPKWVLDSVNPIKVEEEMEVEVEREPKYTWSQTEEEITVWIPLEAEITKQDLEISVNDLKMEVKAKNSSQVSGDFFHRVNKELTTWIFGKGQLELQLTKHESGLMWKSLFPGDDTGKEIVDPEMAKAIHEKLAHLCSEKEEESGSAPSFNSQQLEECDVVSCETTALTRINGETHETSHEVSLSSLQWLFCVSREPGETPAVCVRHDVDACVWQFRRPENDDRTWPHEHVGTFSAFGYVQASKTQKKFVASSPDLSYVALAEASHRIYIYRQPSTLTSELKNRHTGKKVEAISKQHMVNLETRSQILGMHATNDFLFVLLENSLCALAVSV